MPIRNGQLLKDKRSGEERFRIEDLISDGRSFYLARGQDTHLEDMTVALKAIKYSEDPGQQEIEERVAALRLEQEVLCHPSTLFPEPVDWIEVESDLGHTETEPILVTEYIHGKTLRTEIQNSSQGMDPARALRLVHEIASTLADLHDAGFVFRDLDPDHIIIGFDDVLHLVGTGNVARAKSRPLAAKMDVSPRYSAPELRAERSGKFITPKADVYGLGALFSYLLTGEEPTTAVESPLTAAAYGRLLAMPEGYRLLVARSLQPMAKKRFASVRAMLKHLSPHDLPTRQTAGFQQTELPIPFESNQPVNRATRSKLSSGPLISQPVSTPPAPSQAASPVPWWRGCLPWAATFLFCTAAYLAW